MAEAVEIPYAIVEAMMGDLVLGLHGDGLDSAGRPFSIQRYVSSTTGKIYDCVFSVDEGPRCMELPPASAPEPE